MNVRFYAFFPPGQVLDADMASQHQLSDRSHLSGHTEGPMVRGHKADLCLLCLLCCLLTVGANIPPFSKDNVYFKWQ